jgi:hypothetical protein
MMRLQDSTFLPPPHPPGSLAKRTPGFSASCMRSCRQQFFVIGFNLIVLTTKLLVADYFVAAGSFMLAAAALIVGKAVLIANAMPFLRRYDRGPLIQPILLKTFVYWAVVFLARILEDFVCFSLITIRTHDVFFQGGEASLNTNTGSALVLYRTL